MAWSGNVEFEIGLGDCECLWGVGIVPICKLEVVVVPEGAWVPLKLIFVLEGQGGPKELGIATKGNEELVGASGGPKSLGIATKGKEELEGASGGPKSLGIATKGKDELEGVLGGPK